MAGFDIVKGEPHIAWFPVNCGTGPTATTVYNGQLVYNPNGGMKTIIAAVAKPEVICYPFGVVIGNNNRTPLFSSTYNAEYISSTITQATSLARDWFGAEGMWAKGDPQAMVHVAMLDRTCILEGPIAGATISTAPEVVTCTTADTDGLTGMVHSTLSWTPVANNVMFYCRSGANAGFYRSSYAASKTTPTFYSPWPKNWAVGDTFCVVPIAYGRQYAEFYGGVGLWVSSTDDLTEAYQVDVISMDLSVAGKEKVQFKFVTSTGH